MSEQEPGERPRWSFTWLLRVQRVGRNRRPESPDETVADRRVRRWGFIAIIAGIIIAEVVIGIWLGILPR